MLIWRIAISSAALLLSGCIIYAPVDLGALGAAGEVEESTVLGEDGPKLALIELTGLISDQPTSNPIGLRPTPSPVSELRSWLDYAADDDDVAGLLLRINSPGGTVSASETVYHELTSWARETEKPLVAYFNGMAASGGYYVAMATDEVIAHPTSITGSIGVIMPGLNFSELMSRYGVKDQSFTSGAFKDTGSSVRNMRADERAQIEAVIDDLYRRFTEVVDTGRPKLDRAEVEKLADGRIYTANQALAVGLIDEIGYLEDAVEALEELAGIEESQVVMYHRANRTKDNIYSRLPGGPVELNVNLWPWKSTGLSAGFYYLWPLALRP
ncbi:MAG: signal peptide peptidase SppA [bacterium]|nr:signal peptide peptidase SppA [bacterium]